MYFPCQGWPWALDAGRAASYHTDRTRTRLGRASQHQPEGLARPVRGVWPHPRLCWGQLQELTMARPLGLQPQRVLVTECLLSHVERRGQCGEWDAGAAPVRPTPAGRTVRSGGRIPRPKTSCGLLGRWAYCQSPRTPRPVTPAHRGRSPPHAEVSHSCTLSVHAEEDTREPPMLRGTASRDRSHTGSIKCPHVSLYRATGAAEWGDIDGRGRLGRGCPRQRLPARPGPGASRRWVAGRRGGRSPGPGGTGGVDSTGRGVGPGHF